jgi:hypothetical protein
VTDKSNAGFDIECEPNKTKVSVKMITAENKRGRSSKIKHDWNELIGVEIDANFNLIRLGVIKRNNFEKELTKRKRI